jgi:hypothetical protein
MYLKTSGRETWKQGAGKGKQAGDNAADAQLDGLLLGTGSREKSLERSVVELGKVDLHRLLSDRASLTLAPSNAR